MNDPYEVLGVSPNASEEEIKNAYRELVKKYHPDKYVDNPLADLAEEKLREVNEAYDEIMNGRMGSGGGFGSAGGGLFGSDRLGRHLDFKLPDPGGCRGSVHRSIRLAACLHMDVDRRGTGSDGDGTCSRKAAPTEQKDSKSTFFMKNPCDFLLAYSAPYMYNV